MIFQSVSCTCVRCIWIHLKFCRLQKGMVIKMGKQSRKVLGILLTLCIVLAGIPGIQTNAASTEMISTSVSVNGSSTIYAGDEEAEIQMVFSCTPYTNQKQPTDIVLIIDRSGSMQDDFSYLQAAAKEFIEQLKLDQGIYKVGVVDYSDSAASCNITSDKNVLNQYISNLNAGGGTRMSGAIKKAAEMLQSRKQGTVGAIVLMTDGVANDQEQAVVEAQAAKAKNCVFYTVAFTKRTTSNQEQVIANLKKMATSEADHYSVFENSKLTNVYSKIAGKIGAFYPTNVVVTQDLEGQFELVPSSTQNNIPQPVISGNHITWSMNQLGQGTSIIKYKIKAKADTKAGTYNHATGTITYIDYKGNTISRIITPCSITVKRHAPNITSVTPDKCKNGQNQSVTMKVDYLDSNAKVTVDNKTISNANINGDTITFNMPDFTPGKVSVKVTNDDGQYSTETITIEAANQITKVEDNWCFEKDRKIVTITGIDILTKVDNRAKTTVYIGDKKASITAVDVANQTITCKVPSQAKGTYDVKVINAANQETILQNGFEYKEKIPTDQPTITSVEPSVGVSNARLTTKITGTNFKGDRVSLQVIVDGKKASLISVSETEIQCKLPKLATGTYDIKVICSNKAEVTKTNAITITDPAPAPTPVINSISPNVVKADNRTVVTINGENFKGDRGNITVLVGTKKASIMSVSTTDGTIQCKLPYQPAGTYDVKVTFSDNSTASSSVKYQ